MLPPWSALRRSSYIWRKLMKIFTSKIAFDILSKQTSCSVKGQSAVRERMLICCKNNAPFGGSVFLLFTQITNLCIYSYFPKPLPLCVYRHTNISQLSISSPGNTVTSTVNSYSFKSSSVFKGILISMSKTNEFPGFLFLC